MKKGFTLIELLVVIAIIAILAAILFPVFARAREKARATTCTSNQRQIAASIQMYAQDHEELFPNTGNIWTDIKMDAAALVCPTKGKSTPNGYVYNGSLGGLSMGDSTIEDPTAVWVIADGQNTMNTTAPNIATSIGDVDGTRHSGKVITAYADGHVATTNIKVAPIVNFDASKMTFGGDYIDRCRAANTSGVNLYRINFDTTTPLFYSNGATGTPLFYGAFQITGTTVDTATYARIHKNAASWPSKVCYFNNQGSTNGTSVDYVNVFMWKKAQFVGNTKSISNGFGKNSNISLNVLQIDSTGTGRLLVKSGGVYYISQNTMTLTSSTTPTMTALGDSKWAEWNPSATSFDMPASPVYNSIPVNDIQEIGIHVKYSRGWSTFFGMNNIIINAESL